MEALGPDPTAWLCPDCGVPFTYDQDAQRSSQAMGERLNKQLAPFRELLRKLHDHHPAR